MQRASAVEGGRAGDGQPGVPGAARCVLRVGVIGLAGLALAGCGPPEVRLIGPDRPILPVVVAREADATVRSSAEELAQWLHAICDQKPLIVSAGRDVRRGIFVGMPVDFPQHVPKDRLLGLGPEVFWLRTEPDDRVMLIGNTPLAVSHAVYTFLEELGCRWFFPDPVWTVVPHRTELRVKLDRIERPHYRWRRIWYGWGARTTKLRQDFLAWQRHNKLPGVFNVVCNPVYDRFLARSRFTAHPEQFALIDGRRDPRQICMTRRDVLDRAVQYVLDQLNDDPHRAVSLECGRGDRFCECPNCRSLGPPNDRPFWFANRVASKVASQRPDGVLTLYAYDHHADPPPFAMHPRVHVQIVNGFRHSRMPFDQAVNLWSACAPSFGVYDYWSVWPWDRDMPGRAPAARTDYLIRYVPEWFDKGASTLDVEASCNWGPNGLGYYAAAKLMWNTRTDVPTLVDDFHRRAFGRAAGCLRRYYQRWDRGEPLTERTLALSYRDLAEAGSHESDPGVRRRLARLKMYLHFLRLSLAYDRAVQRRDRTGTVRLGQGLIRFARRITDTGLVHVWPMLYSEWFDKRFEALLAARPDSRDLLDETLTSDPVPSDAEVDRLFADGQRRYAVLPVVDVGLVSFSRNLIRLAPRRWMPMARLESARPATFYAERARYYFVGSPDRRTTLRFRPCPGQRIDCTYRVRRVLYGNGAAQGHLQGKRGQPVSVVLPVRGEDTYELALQTATRRAVQVDCPDQPIVVEASHDHPLILSRPSATQALFFFVPPGTTGFVLHLAGKQCHHGTVTVQDSSGRVVAHQPDLLPDFDVSVRVPNGEDGRIWSLSVDCRRVALDLRGVPPLLAGHPSQLLVPAEALVPASRPTSRPVTTQARTRPAATQSRPGAPASPTTRRAATRPVASQPSR